MTFVPAHEHEGSRASTGYFRWVAARGVGRGSGPAPLRDRTADAFRPGSRRDRTPDQGQEIAILWCGIRRDRFRDLDPLNGG